MAYFRCTTSGSGGGTLTVTCAEDFAGATITCSKSGTTLTKVCPSTSPYEVVFNIPESGTWTVSGTVDNVPYSTTVEIDLDYTAELSNGFDWRTWVDTASLLDSSDYDTLSEVLADEEAIRELCTEHATVNYMCSLDNVNEDLATVIANDIFAKWANLRDYCLDMMYANEAISDEMDEVDKYGYGEWALMPQVPIMTSATAPYGEVIYSVDPGNDNRPWYAFDNSASTAAMTKESNQVPFRIGYDFGKVVRISSLVYIPLKSSESASLNSHTDTFYYSLDGTTWEVLATNEITNDTAKQKNYVSFAPVLCKAIKYETNTPTMSNGYSSMCELQFYAWAPKGNVPVMTSNTAPYGEAFSTNYYSSDLPWKAFDGLTTDQCSATNSNLPWSLGYKSTSPICVKRFKVRHRTDGKVNTAFTLQGSNTGASGDWTDLGSYTNDGTQTTQILDVENNTSYYLYHQIKVTSINGTGAGFSVVQFYGRELSVSVPTMTSNTAPYGVASAYNEYSSQYGAYAAFKPNEVEYGWSSSDSNVSNAYNRYHFANKVVVKMFNTYVKTSGSTSSTIGQGIIQGSNDGSNWVDLFEFDLTNTNVGLYVHDIPNSTPYEYYQMKWVSKKQPSKTYLMTYQLNFYGLDYSEREFESGATKKWLYDHGVELEEFYVDSNIGTKEESYLAYRKPSNSSYAAYMITTDSVLNLSTYSVLRAKVGQNVYNSTSNNNGKITLQVEVTKGISTGYVAYRDNTSADSPNNLYLDISSVNDLKYVGFGWGVQGTFNFDIKEMWLE